MRNVVKLDGSVIKSAGDLFAFARNMEKPSNGQFLLVSAFGESERLLREIAAEYLSESDVTAPMEALRSFYKQLLSEVAPDPADGIQDDIENVFVEIEWALEEPLHPDERFVLDQIVSNGALLSSKITAAALRSENYDAVWVDSRDFIRTDNQYGTARVDREVSKDLLVKLWGRTNAQIVVSQAGTGVTSENYSTLLHPEEQEVVAALLKGV